MKSKTAFDVRADRFRAWHRCVPGPPQFTICHSLAKLILVTNRQRLKSSTCSNKMRDFKEGHLENVTERPGVAQTILRGSRRSGLLRLRIPYRAAVENAEHMA